MLPVKTPIQNVLSTDETRRLRHLRRQTWFALGSGFASLLLGMASLCAVRLDVRKLATDNASRWQRLSASENNLAAQLSALKQELARLNETVVSLTNRPHASGVSAIRPTIAIPNAEHAGFLDSFPARKPDDSWWSDYEQMLRTSTNDANISSMLPIVGGDNWRAGLIIVPNGPEGVNKQGVQSSSYFFGIKGSLP